MTFTTIQSQFVDKKGRKKNSKPLKYETEFELGVTCNLINGSGCVSCNLWLMQALEN